MVLDSYDNDGVPRGNRTPRGREVCIDILNARYERAIYDIPVFALLPPKFRNNEDWIYVEKVLLYINDYKIDLDFSDADASQKFYDAVAYYKNFTPEAKMMTLDLYIDDRDCYGPEETPMVIPTEHWGDKKTPEEDEDAPKEDDTDRDSSTSDCSHCYSYDSSPRCCFCGVEKDSYADDESDKDSINSNDSYDSYDSKNSQDSRNKCVCGGAGSCRSCRFHEEN